MNDASVLVLNSGSSSLKFAFHSMSQDDPVARLRGRIDGIGAPGTRLTITRPDGGGAEAVPLADCDHRAAAGALLDWSASQDGLLAGVAAVGHRVVHGMAHTRPERVTAGLLDELRRFVALDPDHLPTEIALIEAFMEHLPDVPHIACFDTSFHAGLPDVARRLAIPRRYDAKGIRRYGFHGISYAYLTEELARSEGRAEARRRVVMAHLGSGASMAAVLDGRSIDTSMAFTPTAGLPMSSRSGDLDPGIGAYLARTEHLSAEDFFSMASHESGLLGISETSADMRELLARQASDVRAAEAVAFFCYEATKCIGAFAAALGGIDTLVFSGGIGESSDEIRARICARLGFLGIAIDAARNAGHADVISGIDDRVTVRVIRTDEELMIARSVRRLLQTPESQPASPTT